MFWAVAFCISISIALLLGEMAVRLVLPQQSMYPRGQIASGYGYVLYKNTNVEHETPGEWSYVYSHNRYGYRGEAIPLANIYKNDNIVVLGDSNSYGIGVHDGEEYPAIMHRKLDDENVVNLSVWGYGLSQQMRRFYEFGILYQPKIVVLQFCANDPTDNLRYNVTYVEDGRILFRDSEFGTSWIKDYLSNSIIQKSQLYNFIRVYAYRILENRRVGQLEEKKSDAGIGTSSGETSEEELLHVQLLEAFARDLKDRDVKLILISVNDQLDGFPYIYKSVEDLEEQGLLDYVDIVPLFHDFDDYASPQGHEWGTEAHRRIGEYLSQYITDSKLPIADK